MYERVINLLHTTTFLSLPSSHSLFLHFSHPSFLPSFPFKRAGGGGKGRRERGRERISSRLHTQCGSQSRAPSHDSEITTRVETKCWTLGRLSHPSTPVTPFILENFFSCPVTTDMKNETVFFFKTVDLTILWREIQEQIVTFIYILFINVYFYNWIL